MQNLRQPLVPPLHSSFKTHRSSIDQTRFNVNLTLPKPILAPVWASLPTPPMSGSPPPDPPKEPPQVAGRRRKRSETPPTTTSTSVVSPPTPLEQTAPSTGAPVRGGQAFGESPSQHSFAPTYPAPQSYGSSSAISIPSGQSAGQFGASPISPRATRKTKAHVASACVNCKKKHLRCDNSRPCRRCMQSGKEESCHDVEHKKRGRPPLKPDDPSNRRPFESALSPLSGRVHDPSSRLPAPDPGSYVQTQGYRPPFRTLQAGPYDPNRGQMRGPYQSSYAQPSVSQSSAIATGQFAGRQYQQEQGYPVSHLPPGYIASPAETQRPLAPYLGPYHYPPQQMHMGPPQPPYSAPLFPRPAQSDPFLAMQGQGSLQLPPILPAPQGSPIDPAIAQQQRQQTQQTQQPSREPPVRSDESGRERDPKRPKMDIQGILGPRTD